ncbi:hypothetical protein [Cryptosporangium japonicum]|uniref:hypothetical protein n=1 Tax=Cryptosporangium japonicum TaxID=80872 RepID=UPI0031E0F0C6
MADLDHALGALRGDEATHAPELTRVTAPVRRRPGRRRRRRTSGCRVSTGCRPPACCCPRSVAPPRVLVVATFENDD